MRVYINIKCLMPDQQAVAAVRHRQQERGRRPAAAAAAAVSGDDDGCAPLAAGTIARLVAHAAAGVADDVAGRAQLVRQQCPAGGRLLPRALGRVVPRLPARVAGSGGAVARKVPCLPAAVAHDCGAVARVVARLPAGFADEGRAVERKVARLLAPAGDQTSVYRDADSKSTPLRPSDHVTTRSACVCLSAEI